MQVLSLADGVALPDLNELALGEAFGDPPLREERVEVGRLDEAARGLCGAAAHPLKGEELRDPRARVLPVDRRRALEAKERLAKFAPRNVEHALLEPDLFGMGVPLDRRLEHLEGRVVAAAGKQRSDLEELGGGCAALGRRRAWVGRGEGHAVVGRKVGGKSTAAQGPEAQHAEDRLVALAVLRHGLGTVAGAFGLSPTEPSLSPARPVRDVGASRASVKSQGTAWPAVSDLKEGDIAPLFTLQDDEGHPFSLADELGKAHIVLYFYPKDDTPGCRAEAQAFRDEVKQFFGLEATIIGVSTGTVVAKAEFKRKYALNFRLLADEDKSVTRLYGALGLLGLSPRRITFVIGKDGRIRRVFASPLPYSHLDAAKEALFQMREEEDRGAARAAPAAP